MLPLYEDHGGREIEEGAEVAPAVLADDHKLGLEDAEADVASLGAEAAGAEGFSGHECGKWCGCLRKSHTHDGAQQRRYPINLLIRHLQ